MLANPATLYAQAAQKRCLQVAEEICEVLRAMPEPRITGRLLEGYRAVKDPPDGAAVVTDVPYWEYVEFGTRKMRARPHVRPAIEIVRRRNRS